MDAADERAFRDFVAARSPALMGLAYLLTGGDQHAAEDLVQTSLAKAVTRWRGIEDPEAYVKRTMYHQQISTWRLAWRRHETSVAEPPDTAAADGTGAVDLRLALRQALARLTPRQRTVLVLRYFEDLPEDEIARILGCSVGTVRSTAHRSLARLRALATELTPAYEELTR
ncbi:DNA-directed RNA polymerase sigma-70 factor [Acrocarpospora phusangensis]|uniref:DNA-directed RNA polymerase sigma-70 factor n=1 Tax=Acrocarpospora phusangensis TaxID=1070424 RepID=A0A919QB32_9ACTN|nr:SigE family RNA polymerase sigma factor [Acrocarpospora phusangensis]GIH25388.1 DNA-directed RNA polymerase sigma-70 factor [Acrocarpospora phusangensis]